jgi:hypothetical protein
MVPLGPVTESEPEAALQLSTQPELLGLGAAAQLPVYGFWFYSMFPNVVGPVLPSNPGHPGMNHKRPGDVDTLLKCEVQV